MPKVLYVEKKFRSSSLDLIDKINGVIWEYAGQGYSLTLRQCYYQLVARGIIPNNQKSYKNVGNLINDARLAGLIDWNSIEDRTRNLQKLSHWSSPEQIIGACADQYRRNLWETQDVYLEVWVEKEALSNVVGRVSNELDIPYFCCRGYVSQSEMWAASRRFIDYQQRGKHVVLLHLGDHDPSGIDMSRDIEERLKMFWVSEDGFTFKRIALSMEQIQTYSPPPNPAKTTDSRFISYINQFGEESWELDALEPRVIHDLITSEVDTWVNHQRMEDVRDRSNDERQAIQNVADNWDEIYDQYR